MKYKVTNIRIPYLKLNLCITNPSIQHAKQPPYARGREQLNL